MSNDMHTCHVNIHIRYTCLLHFAIAFLDKRRSVNVQGLI